ncbi:MAG TPA: NADPH-dependent assimilatory sulfite reductase hemoprotein subunit [Gammaproteobacteria bacterium]
MSEIDRSRDLSQPLEKLGPNETLKANSRFLRGTIAESLQDPITGAVTDDDTKLMKFHGIYQQDDRDLRDERRQQKLEPAYQFMVRVRLPGGVCTPQQWRKLDELADRYGDGGLRLTTRQTFQFHGVLKHNLRLLIQGMREVGLDTIAACGDDNRGVMCAVNPHLSKLHKQLHELARDTSALLRPRTGAYSETWYGEPPAAANDGEEPVYGPTYLPRKFKIGFAVPPVNDIDIFTQDLGFIAIRDGEELLGFNVSVGGGMGRQDNNNKTYPRLGDVIGFIEPGRVFTVAETVMGIQRDFGDRADRQHARFKYTLDTHGLDWFKTTLHERLGFELDPPRPFEFDTQGDAFGWQQGSNGNWHYTLLIQSGRIRDSAHFAFKTELLNLIVEHEGELRITPNQNLVFANIPPGRKTGMQQQLEALQRRLGGGRLEQNAIACVALPTCGLAMAESERYLPDLLGKIRPLLEANGLGDTDITIRMSGCPNGCSRPYVAEIGFTGRAPGKYNLYLGADRRGQRLNKLYRENIGEKQILEELAKLFAHYAKERQPDEAFGDFTVRAGYVAAVRHGREFND